MAEKAAGMDELENKLKDAIATKEMYHKYYEAELAERLKVQKLLEAERGSKELLQDSYRQEGIAKKMVEIELRQARWELEESKTEIARLQQALAALEAGGVGANPLARTAALLARMQALG